MTEQSHTDAFAVTFSDIQAAARRLHGRILRTPVISSRRINDRVGCEVFFKCENLQYEGAFKSRGACNAVFSLTDAEASAGVVTHSSGNHAAALARAAALRGIGAHIVMPRNSAAVKIEAVRRYGVEPVFCEPDAESRQSVAERVMRETGATFVHPFDDPRVIAGQGTSVLELLEEIPSPDAVIVPVGGGGLLSGTLIATRTPPRSSSAPRADAAGSVAVYGAEPAWADDAVRSLRAGVRQPPNRYDSIADGLRTGIGELTFPIIRDLVADILIADEEAVRDAVRLLLLEAKLLVEPSGAVPLAMLMQHRERFRGMRVGIILSGGNVDERLLQTLLSAERPQ